MALFSVSPWSPWTDKEALRLPLPLPWCIYTISILNEICAWEPAGNQFASAGPRVGAIVHAHSERCVVSGYLYYDYEHR